MRIFHSSTFLTFIQHAQDLEHIRSADAFSLYTLEFRLIFVTSSAILRLSCDNAIDHTAIRAGMYAMDIKRMVGGH